MSKWNHRVLAHEHNGEIYLKIHDVYYNEAGIPNSYTENAVSVGGEDRQSIYWTIDKMRDCIKKPILFAGDKFPQEYTPEN